MRLTRWYVRFAGVADEVEFRGTAAEVYEVLRTYGDAVLECRKEGESR